MKRNEVTVIRGLDRRNVVRKSDGALVGVVVKNELNSTVIWDVFVGGKNIGHRAGMEEAVQLALTPGDTK